jgi:pyrroline-5-carboxylate reductase
MSDGRARLAVLGGGNMARAILLGALRSGVVGQEDIVVAEPDGVKREVFQREGVRAAARFRDLGERIGSETSVMLAVKPQVLPEVAGEVAETCGGGERVVVSILAGARGAGIRERLGAWARVVRVMPNTPAQVGRGVSAITLSAGAREGDDRLARELMGAVGRVVDLPEELFDAFTAVAGSGPAYVFYLAEAMARGAVACGIDPAQADEIVRGVISGSAALLDASRDSSASELRAAVTSRGGTTLAATSAMDESGVMTAIERAIVAARDRGRELGG